MGRLTSELRSQWLEAEQFLDRRRGTVTLSDEVMAMLRLPAGQPITVSAVIARQQELRRPGAA
jgi:hypothetical protein